MAKGTCTIGDCSEPTVGQQMCKRHYRAEYYRRNRDRELATMAEWRAKNHEYDRARQCDWYHQNPEYFAAKYRANREVLLQRGREHRAANPGAGTQSSREWRKANPERWALRNRENARRRRGDKPVSYSAVLTEHGMTCHICAKPITDFADLHFDHVIPLAKGGPHSPDNIRPAHALCNLRKSDRIA